MPRIATNFKTNIQDDRFESVRFFSVLFVSSVAHALNFSFVSIRGIRDCRLLYSIPAP